MKKRVAKKIMKNKAMLKYSDRQIEQAQQLLEKPKPRVAEDSKD